MKRKRNGKREKIKELRMKEERKKKGNKQTNKEIKIEKNEK